MRYAPIPMVPGPVSLYPAALDALRADYGSGDLEPAFAGLYAATSRGLARIAGTRNDVVLMTGEGMLALWSALKSALKPGDPVVSVGNGVFGDGIGAMAASLGCRVEAVSFPYNTTLSADDLNRVAEAVRRIRPVMITAVHCETPSGSLNPLAGLGALKRDLGVPLLAVDAVASLAGAPVETDAWHIDLTLGGSQKCLSAPPSMSFMTVSEAAWERIAEVKYQGYDALLPFRRAAGNELPYTPYWHGVAVLHAVVQALEAEGLAAVFARHEAVAARCRAGLADLGLTLWTAPGAVPSPTVTAALVPEGFTWPEWDARLRAMGLVCGGSYGPMAGKVFRLGHMGSQADMALMDEALRALARVLNA